ncbi:transmembrane protein 17 [Theileria orientalis]|uniref:Transmembrane protein 17 n=1 Tax=Theileria orientalis TaxID=68886 RepID=A0A976SLH5_THEOR|nr:transmembrane protein 17 [Theileria orientalis]
MKILISTAFLLVSLACATNVDLERENSNHLVTLTESTFEKLTQASSGSTTGTWFVKFYAPWCSHCRKMAPAWESLAKELKGHVNVADVDVTRNPKLGRRFQIKGYPTLVLFHKGKMYHYEGGERTVEKLSQFALGEFSKVAALPVPAPLSVFAVASDFVVSGVNEALRVYDAALAGFVTISTFAFLFGLVVGLVLSLFLFTRKATRKPKVLTERKKDK